MWGDDKRLISVM